LLAFHKCSNVYSFGILGYSVEKIIDLTDPQDIDQFRIDFSTHGSAVHKTYRKGKTTGEYNLDKNLFDKARKATMMKGSQKYAENYTGLNQQSFASNGHERWPNKIRGYAEKEGQTGLPSSYHGSSIATYPARNKRDVWTLSTKPLKEAHFASYPPELILPCILAGCPEHGIVLDPFMGSGTTAIVAKQNNRNYIGFELNPEYVAIAEKRINLL